MGLGAARAMSKLLLFAANTSISVLILTVACPPGRLRPWGTGDDRATPTPHARPLVAQPPGPHEHVSVLARDPTTADRYRRRRPELDRCLTVVEEAMERGEHVLSAELARAVEPYVPASPGMVLAN